MKNIHKLITKELIIKEFEKLFLELKLKPDEVSTGKYNYIVFRQKVEDSWYEIEINFGENNHNEIEIFLKSNPPTCFDISDPDAFDKTIDYVLSILSRWSRWQRRVILIRKERMEL